MSTYFYGSAVKYWEAYGLYSTSSTNTTYTISLTGGWYTVSGWRYDIGSYVSCTATAGDDSSSVSGQSISETTNGPHYHALTSTSTTITKGTSSQKITLTVVTKSTSSYHPGTSTATTTVTVPALTSYTITYNANGGSGAPSSQTKYYGKTLTLSSTKPTRTNYNFLGWATSSSATSATYSAGGSYTANASATLYAVWELAYIAPTISSFKAYRANSSGTAADDGTYLYTYIKATADRTSNTSNNIATVVYSVKGSSTKTYSYSNSSQTATLTKTISASLSESTAYTVTATVTDSNGLTASKTVAVPRPFYLIDIDDGGAGVGLLTTAPTAGLNIADDVSITAAEGDHIRIVLNNATEDTDTCLRVKRNDTGQNLYFGIGSSGYNRGVYDSTLGEWLFYADSSDIIHVGASGGTVATCALGSRYPVQHSTSRMLIQSGSTSVTISATSTNCSADVTFGTAYSSTPIVVASPVTSSPLSVSCGVNDISTTGFTAYVARTDSTVDTGVRWIAIGQVSSI